MSTSHHQMSMPETITASYSIVPHTERMSFLPKNYGQLMMIVESMVYYVSDKTIRQKPAFWEFAYINDLPFLYPKIDIVTIRTMDGYGETDMPGPIAGIITTAIAYQIVAEKAEKGTLQHPMSILNTLKSVSDEQVGKLIDMYYGLLAAGRELAAKVDLSSEYFHLTD